MLSLCNDVTVVIVSEVPGENGLNLVEELTLWDFSANPLESPDRISNSVL